MAYSFSALRQKFVKQRKKDAARRRHKRQAKKEKKAKQKEEMAVRGHDKQWAYHYLIDPLNAPEPFEETGPGSSHQSEYTRQATNAALARTAENQSLSSEFSGDIPESPSTFGDSGPDFSYPSPPLSPGHRYPVKPASNPLIPERGHLRNQSYPASLRQLHPTNPYHSQYAMASSASQHRRTVSDGSKHRTYDPNRTLQGRHPGDMSHRPLDIIKRENRTADRRHRKRFSNADTIDLLDHSYFGPTLHHEGPYDAALAGHNAYKKYSPLDAVRESNAKALRATPQAFINDSLIKHRPLQGTAIVPPGSADYQGNIMDYEEGADLMREPDAAGGAYRRYEGIKYHPDDLKGKGEPSYTYERDLKDKQRKLAAGNANDVELQSLMSRDAVPRVVPGSRSSVRRASDPSKSSNATVAEASGSGAVDGEAASAKKDGHHRFSSGLRKRFGSLRRKKSVSEPAS